MRCPCGKDHSDERRLRERVRELEAQVAALTGALTSIAANTCCGSCQEAALVARAALAACKETPGYTGGTKTLMAAEEERARPDMFTGYSEQAQSAPEVPDSQGS